MSEFDSCAVCGRTILAGERTRVYVTAEGVRQPVCELCRERAEHHGWVSEEDAVELSPAAPKRRRGALGAFLRPLGPRDAIGGHADAEGLPAESPDEAPPRNPDPAARGATVGRSLPDATEPKSRLDLAIESFNLSSEARTVGGLIRTLGSPWVSVGAASGSLDEVRITVAWELSWYQWSVDVNNEAHPVTAISKGREVSELDASAQQWNATAGEAGQLRLGADYTAPDEAGPERGRG